MKMTLREAADSVGRNKSTVFRAIKDGRLKSTRSEGGIIFIDSDELISIFPPENSENRAKSAKRGRPCGSRKKQQDGTIPETPQATILSQEIIRLEREKMNLFAELSQVQGRNTVDHIRLQDLVVDKERLMARITMLEKILDDTRAESSTKDGKIFILETEKQKLHERVERMENAFNEFMKSNKDTKDMSKKSFLEKIFA